jgi:hypothetical protein
MSIKSYLYVQNGRPGTVAVVLVDTSQADQYVNVHLVSDCMQATPIGQPHYPPAKVEPCTVDWVRQKVPARGTTILTAQFKPNPAPHGPSEAKITAVVCSSGSAGYCKTHNSVLHFP